MGPSTVSMRCESAPTDSWEGQPVFEGCTKEGILRHMKGRNAKLTRHQSLMRQIACIQPPCTHDNLSSKTKPRHLTTHFNSTYIEQQSSAHGVFINLRDNFFEFVLLRFIPKGGREPINAKCFPKECCSMRVSSRLLHKLRKQHGARLSGDTPECSQSHFQVLCIDCSNTLGVQKIERRFQVRFLLLC